MVYTDVMFNSALTVTALAQMNAGSGTTAGDYTPKVSGTLKQIRVIVGGQAATSLVETYQIELECTEWQPNRQRFRVTGGGIATAPSGIGGTEREFVFALDQPVKTNVIIKGEAYSVETTAVTPRVSISGVFT